jgi:hypothetical protein
MNRFFCSVALGVVALGIFLLAADSAMAIVVYTANFDSGMEGWDLESENDAGRPPPTWGSSGGQDGGFFEASRKGSGPYILPPTSSPLYGDLPSNFGSNQLSFSYYLKTISGPIGGGAHLYMFADTDSTPGWDTDWTWTPSGDNPVPADWTHYAFTVDTTATTTPAGWSKTEGPGSWADSWRHITYWNFFSVGGDGSTTLTNGIDTVRVMGVPEPTTISLLTTALVGMLAYAWRKRK